MGDASPVGEDARPNGKVARPIGKGARPIGREALTTRKGARPNGKGARPIGEAARPNGKGALPRDKAALQRLQDAFPNRQAALSNERSKFLKEPTDLRKPKDNCPTSPPPPALENRHGQHEQIHPSSDGRAQPAEEGSGSHRVRAGHRRAADGKPLLPRSHNRSAPAGPRLHPDFANIVGMLGKINLERSKACQKRRQVLPPPRTFPALLGAMYLSERRAPQNETSVSHRSATIVDLYPPC